MALKISVIDSSISWEKSVSKRQAIKEVADIDGLFRQMFLK